MNLKNVTQSNIFCGYWLATLVPAQYPHCGDWSSRTRSRSFRAEERHCCTTVRASACAGTTRGLREFAGTGSKADSTSTRRIDLASFLFNTTLRVLAGTSGYLNGLYTCGDRSRRGPHALTHIGLGNPDLEPASTRRLSGVTARSTTGSASRVIA